MPRIYDPKIAARSGLMQSIPDDSLKQLGQVVSAFAAKREQDSMAVDIANFQMDQIRVMEQIQNSGSHNTASKKDLLGGTVLESGIPDYYMRQFNDKALGIEKKYPQAKESISNYRVQQFGKVTNIYSGIKNTADLDFFKTHINEVSSAVERGTILEDEAIGASSMLLDTLYLPPEMRNAAHQSMTDAVYMASFDGRLRDKPSSALDALEQNRYVTASAGALAQMNDKFDRFVHTKAMEEVQSANMATQDTFRHSPKSDALTLAKRRGLHDVASALSSAYALNARIDQLTSGDLRAAATQTAAEYKLAHKLNNPQMKADAEMKQKFIQQRMSVAYSNPELIAVQEGIEVPEYTMEDTGAFVVARRWIRDAISKKQNSDVSLFGQDGAAIVKTAKTLPADKRPEYLTSITRQLNSSERKDAIKELGELDPLFGVAVAVTPQGVSAGKPEYDLMADILGDAAKEYVPDHKLYRVEVSEYFSGVEVGDPAVIDHYAKAAANVYARRAQRGGWTEYDADNMTEILGQIVGPTGSFGSGKMVSFKTGSGAWADPDVLSTKIEEHINSGLITAQTPSGELIKPSSLTKYGRLIPTGEHAKYYISDNVNQYFLDKNGVPLVIDAGRIYESGEMDSYEQWKNR